MLCPQGSQLHGRSVLLADQQYKQLFPYSLLGSATVQATVTALNGLGIRVLGMGPGAGPTAAPGPSFGEDVLLSALARLTGAVDGGGVPLVFDTSAPGG